MIQLKNLCIGYSGRSIRLPGITGTFKYGSMTAIIGANGIGKSTFLKTLAGFLPPASGELKFVNSKRPKTSYLPQRFNIDCKFPLTVFDVVAMGCWPEIGFLEKTSERKINIILESLQCVKLDKMIRSDISVLSVGQFQCMLFARLLVQQSSLILLDEPFNSIDNKICDLMLSIIDKLCKNGSTVVIVVHDRGIMTKYFSHALLLSRTMHRWKTYLK